MSNGCGETLDILSGPWAPLTVHVLVLRSNMDGWTRYSTDYRTQAPSLLHHNTLGKNAVWDSPTYMYQGEAEGAEKAHAKITQLEVELRSTVVKPMPKEGRGRARGIES
jgi:hypothetical protein